MSFIGENVRFGNKHWILISTGSQGIDQVRHELQARYAKQMYMLDRIQNSTSSEFNCMDPLYIHTFTEQIKNYSLSDLKDLYLSIQTIDPTNPYVCIVETRLKELEIL